MLFSKLVFQHRVRAASSRNSAEAENSGTHASKSRANRARAKTLSSSAIVSAAACSGPCISRKRFRQLFNIRKISAASSSASCTSWLFCLHRFEGSTNTVCPVPLAPCTTPCTLPVLRAHGDHEAVVPQGDVVFSRLRLPGPQNLFQRSVGWTRASAQCWRESAARRSTRRR